MIAIRNMKAVLLCLFKTLRLAKLFVHINYNGLWFDNTFDPETLNSRKFEVDKNKATISDNIIDIESTDIKATYDLMYSVREVSRDDLLYLYFLNHKLVAVKVLVQC